MNGCRFAKIDPADVILGLAKKGEIPSGPRAPGMPLLQFVGSGGGGVLVGASRPGPPNLRRWDRSANGHILRPNAHGPSHGGVVPSI